MSYRFEKLGPERFLVWDLLRETDPYYLNHHLFDTDLTAVEADRAERRASGKPVPSYVAYTLAAYGRSLAEYPNFNSYLRLYPLTRLAIYDGVDISLTIEREWEGRRIVLLGLLRNAQEMGVEAIHQFLASRRDAPLESLEEFQRYKTLLKLPAFCRWHLFQIFCKPFPRLMRQIVGTTAFTSIGKFGTTMTTPLSPRSCTLSLGKVEDRPRARSGQAVVTRSVWLTLTYDHRVADGAEIAAMGDRLRERLERWPAEPAPLQKSLRG